MEIIELYPSNEDRIYSPSTGEVILDPEADELNHDVCLHRHTGPYAGGSKCSQCSWGYMKRHN